MQKKNKFIIAASILTVGAVAGISVGATAALFSADTTAKIHITAGTLDIGFYLTSLKYDQVVDNKVTQPEADLESEYDDAYVTKTYGEGDDAISVTGVDLKKLDANAVFEVGDIFPSFTGTATFVVVNWNNAMPVDLSFDYTKSVVSAPESEHPEADDMGLDLDFFSLTDDNDDTTPLNAHAFRTIHFDFRLSEFAGNDFQGAEFDFDVVLTATQHLTTDI